MGDERAHARLQAGSICRSREVHSRERAERSAKCRKQILSYITLLRVQEPLAETAV